MKETGEARRNVTGKRLGKEKGYRTSWHNASKISRGPDDGFPEAMHVEQQRMGSGPLVNTDTFLVQALQTT
jgi:hypothetical protein